MALEWVAAIVVMVTRSPLDSVKPAAQRALHAACVDARAVEDRQDLGEEPEPRREAEGQGGGEQ
eukprot:4837116-Alexandrium_andersonii.AAC.1